MLDFVNYVSHLLLLVLNNTNSTNEHTTSGPLVVVAQQKITIIMHKRKFQGEIHRWICPNLILNPINCINAYHSAYL